MTLAGVKSLKIDDATLSIKRDIRASAGGNVPALAKALIQAGKEEFVNDAVNPNRLSAWVRDVERQVSPDAPLDPEEIIKHLPQEVRSKIKVHEMYSVGARV